jgi:hypothetical protein
MPQLFELIRQHLDLKAIERRAAKLLARKHTQDAVVNDAVAGVNYFLEAIGEKDVEEAVDAYFRPVARVLVAELAEDLARTAKVEQPPVVVPPPVVVASPDTNPAG